METNNTMDILFLAKLQLLVQTFNDIDDMIKNLPQEQQAVDYELSDYLHIIEREDLDEQSMIEVTKKLKASRQKREKLRATNDLKEYYNLHKSNLLNKVNRIDFENNLKSTMNKLHCEYKYRVLSEDEVKELTTHTEIVNESSDDKHKKYAISKEDLIDCINKGMKGVDIAKKFGVAQLTVSNLKKRYGLGTRAYNKRR